MLDITAFCFFMLFFVSSAFLGILKMAMCWIFACFVNILNIMNDSTYAFAYFFDDFKFFQIVPLAPHIPGKPSHLANSQN